MLLVSGAGARAVAGASNTADRLIVVGLVKWYGQTRRNKEEQSLNHPRAKMPQQP